MIRTPSWRRCRGPIVVLVAAAAALASCTTAPLSAQAGPSGPVELRWHCWNGIFTPAGTGGDRWWAGASAQPTGPLEADPAPNDGNHEHVATGVLAVLDADTATFTSSAGGQLALQRAATDAVFPAYCQLAPP